MNGSNTALRVGLALAVGLTLATTGATASADEQGTVLKIDGSDIYIDLGTKNGVGGGATLTLMHVIVAKNPVTNKTLRDRFPLGQLRVVKAGEGLCIAHASQELLARVKVGDEVVLASAPGTFDDPWVSKIDERARARAARLEAKKKAEMPADPKEREARIRAEHAAAVARAQQAIDAAEVAQRVWRTTLGKAPQDRIAIWQAYLDADPSSRYAESVRGEIASLQAQIAAEEAAAQQANEPDNQREDERTTRLALLNRAMDIAAPLAVDAPRQVYEGEGVALAFTVLMPSAVARAWLYYRRRGEATFQRTNLTFDGDVYMRGRIPGEVARPPGIEFFVESAGGDQDGPPTPVIGSQERPRLIRVQKKVEDAPSDKIDRSRVTLFTDYVDFDSGFGDGFDQYIHTEVDFMYRFLKPIYSVRVGFGTLGGVGGPKDIIDAAVNNDCLDELGEYRCRRVDFTYSYVEFEYRLRKRPLAIMLRPQFGSGSRDFLPNDTNRDCFAGDFEECEIFQSLGLRLRLRIGEERKTNLTIGLGLTQFVGTVFEAAFTWDVIPQFPIKISAHVTDQPVPEDFGVRLIGDIGWRKYRWFYPSLRISAQARDVDHAGLSGGAAINFDW